MTMPLLKSTALADDPVTLCGTPRAERSVMTGAHGAATYGGYPSDEQERLASVVEPEITEHLPDLEPAPSISYDEYKERFHAELAELAEQAQREGYTQGYAEGQEQAQAEVAEKIAALTDVLKTAQAALESGISGVEEVSVEIVFEAITKVFGTLATDPQAVVATVREVIRHAKERNKLIVRVARHDWAVLQQHRDALIEGLSVGSLDIVHDDRGNS